MFLNCALPLASAPKLALPRRNSNKYSTCYFRQAAPGNAKWLRTILYNI